MNWVISQLKNPSVLNMGIFDGSYFMGSGFKIKNTV